APVDHEDVVPTVGQFSGDGETEEPRAHYEEVHVHVRRTSLRGFAPPEPRTLRGGVLVVERAPDGAPCPIRGFALRSSSRGISWSTSRWPCDSPCTPVP